MSWRDELRYDPVPFLLESGFENVVHFTRKDLLGEPVNDVRTLWELPDAGRILRRQQADGRWKYRNPKAEVRSTANYDLYETYRQLANLVERFGFDRRHEAVRKARRFLLSFQTRAGDIRGIYWKQYSPNYTAGMIELLTKAGYPRDPRVRKSQSWLMAMRQDDGGWVIPVRTTDSKLADWMACDTIEPDRSKPFSYMATGVVLRAFAYNPEYRDNRELRAAAELVLSRLFKRDNYPDRGTPEFWIKFTFPFQYTDLVAVLDPIAHLGFAPTHPRIAAGLDWLKDHQTTDGSWDVKGLKGNLPDQPYWRALSIARLFRLFYR